MSTGNNDRLARARRLTENPTERFCVSKDGNHFRAVDKLTRGSTATGGWHWQRSRLYKSFDDAEAIVKWLIDRATGYASLRQFVVSDMGVES
jgi:hypothetical protein